MQFIEELKKQDQKLDDDYRVLEAIKAGNYKMSIQGSTGAYCSPRETLNVEYYYRMELALFNKNGWLHITKSSVLKSFPRYPELMRCASDPKSDCNVFGYLDIDLIEDLYVYLKNQAQ